MPLLPPRAGTGRPREDNRRVIDGIPYILANSCRYSGWICLLNMAHIKLFGRGFVGKGKGAWYRIFKAIACGYE